jgi:hypothetical protein
VTELAEILQRLTVAADSSTSVLLETIIPLRNPLPPQPVAGAVVAAVRRAKRKMRPRA